MSLHMTWCGTAGLRAGAGDGKAVLAQAAAVRGVAPSRSVAADGAAVVAGLRAAEAPVAAATW